MADAPIRPTDVHVISEKSSVYPTAKAACAAALCSSDPMKRSSRTPAMFIAMPWTPVGSPKRKSDRMMPKSGFRSIPRWKWITESGAKNRQIPIAAASVLLATVPNAAPSVPNRGMRMTLNRTVSAVIATPRRSGVRGSPAARKAPVSRKKSIMPKMPRNIVRRNGSARCCTSGAALTMRRSAGAAK